MDEHVSYAADIEVDPFAIPNKALELGVSFDTMWLFVLSHELGHVVGLDDVDPVGMNSCAFVESVMYDSPFAATCLQTAQVDCDCKTIDDVYSELPGFGSYGSWVTNSTCWWSEEGLSALTPNGPPTKDCHIPGSVVGARLGLEDY